MLASLLLLIDTPEEKNRFEQLYSEYERLMFYVARTRLEDDQLAEDAVNEAFIRIIKHFDKIEEIACPRTRRYVVVIVKNVCIDMLKKRYLKLELPDSDNIDFLSSSRGYVSCGVQDTFFQKYELELIRQELNKLPEIYQNVLYLATVEDLSLSDIADLLDCTVETIKKRLYRARQKLRLSLEKYDDK